MRCALLRRELLDPTYVCAECDLRETIARIEKPKPRWPAELVLLALLIIGVAVYVVLRMP